MWVSKHKEERREDFILSAIELFSEQGYEQTSLNQVIKKLEITKGSFYHNFESKEDLLNKTIEYMAVSIVTLIDEITSNSELESLDMLRALSREMIHFRRQQQPIYQRLFDLQNNSHNAYVAKKFMDFVKSVTFPSLKTIFQRGQKEGQFRLTNIDLSTTTYINCLMIYKQQVIDLYKESHLSKEYKNQQLKELEAIYKKMLGGILGVDSDEIDFIGLPSMEISL